MKTPGINPSVGEFNSSDPATFSSTSCVLCAYFVTGNATATRDTTINSSHEAYILIKKQAIS